MRAKLLTSLFIALLLTISNSSVLSATTSSHPFARHLLAARDSVSLEQAVAQVKKQTRGRILTADTVQHKGKTSHRIKVLLPNGSVRVIYVDAE